MSAASAALISLDVVLWAALLLMQSMQPKRSSLSEYEMKRRAASGDYEAEYELWRISLLPRLTGLKFIFETVVMTAAISTAFVLVGFVVGVSVAIVAPLIVRLFSRTHSVHHMAAKLYERMEPGLLKRVESWAWLGWFGLSQDSRAVRIGSRAELEQLIESAAPTVLSRDDRKMIASQLEFADKTVGSVMTPRTMIDSIDQGETIGPIVLDKLHRTGHSRFPVVDGDLDHVVGMLYLHDLVNSRTSHKTVKSAMSDAVYYIGEQRSLEHALYAFLHAHHHLFIVVNEYRETVGVLSLEDVIEALIGRTIVDEFDEFDNLRSVAESNPRGNNTPKGKNDI